MSEQPELARKAPFAVDVEAGRTYAWCACGRSANQPFCDGSHQGTGFSPVVVKAEKDGTIHFCGCKQTANPPWCDATHTSL